MTKGGEGKSISQGVQGQIETEDQSRAVKGFRAIRKNSFQTDKNDDSTVDC